MNDSDVEFELRSLRQELSGVKVDRDSLRFEVNQLKEMQGIICAKLLRLDNDMHAVTVCSQLSNEGEK